MRESFAATAGALLAALLLLPAPPAAATSLYPGKVVNQQSYYSEIKGLSVGDVVTVVIAERATASNLATTQNSKTATLSATGGNGPLKFLDAMGTTTTSDFEGDGSTSRVTSLSTHITARVMKVLPNGNLVIEGRRMNQINDEVQEMYLKGIVRPVDIAADNTVLSTALGEAEIRLSGRGSGARAAKPGPLQRIFDWVF